MNDAKLIQRLGGPTAVAKLLGLPVHGGQRRVQNWITRGIPARMKLKHPALLNPPKPAVPRIAVRTPKRTRT